MVCLWMFLIFAKFIIERYIVMSEKIVAGNLDEVIGKNVEIRDEMREKALLIRTNWNRMQISSSNQLAMQILKLYGLVQMPLDNQYWSGAIFCKKR